MPIKKNYMIGSNKTTLIEFGTGDIGIIPSRDKYNTSVHYLHLIQAEEGEVGRTSNKYTGKTSDSLKSIPVTLCFRDAKAIQVLIDQLKNVKEYIIKDINLAYSKEEYDIESESRLPELR